MASIEIAGYEKPQARTAYRLDGFKIALGWKYDWRKQGKLPALDISPDIVIYRERPFVFPATKILDIPALMQLMSGVYRIHVPMGIQVWDNLKDKKIRVGTPHNSQARIMKEFLRFHPHAPLRIFSDSKDNFLDVVWLNDNSVVSSYDIPRRSLLWGRGRLATLVRHKPANFFAGEGAPRRNALFADPASTGQPA